MNAMKLQTLVVLLVCLWSFQSPAAASTSAPRLAGILNLPGFKQALVQNVDARSWHRFSLLKEREREGDFEMVEIHPENGTAKVRSSGKTELLSFNTKTASGDGQAPAVALEKAELAPLLRWYGHLGHRNVLQFPSLPAATFDLRESAPDEKSAAAVLEKAFSAKGITAIPDGEKFVIIALKEKSGSLLRRSAPANTGKAPEKAANELLPPGMIQFFGVDGPQVAQFYAELVGRQIERAESLKAAGATIHFISQTPLNREEVKYALDTLLAWHGVELVPVGEKSLKCVRLREPLRYFTSSACRSCTPSAQILRGFRVAAEKSCAFHLSFRVFAVASFLHCRPGPRNHWVRPSPAC